MNNPIYRNLFETMKVPRESIFSKVLIKCEAPNHTLMCLSAGTDISEHTSTREASVTVLKGKDIPMESETFIFMPKNAPYALNASKNLVFLLNLTGK